MSCNNTIAGFVVCFSLLAARAPSIFAANITKATTGTDLTAGASWTNGMAPGSGDIAVSGAVNAVANSGYTPATWGNLAKGYAR
jgi:hypothetical protein